MNKEKFKEICKEQLVEIFAMAKAHKKDDRQKFRTEGFIQAGKVLGLISHEEASTIMEEAHFAVFRESIASRKARKAKLKEAVALGDEEYINIPAYERSAIK